MVARGSKEGRKKSARGKGKTRSSRTTPKNRVDAAKKRVSLRRKAGSIFPKWDYETDVLIVGYGAAGANAAIAAHGAGVESVMSLPGRLEGQIGRGGQQGRR